MKLLNEIAIYPELIAFVNCPGPELGTQDFSLQDKYEISSSHIIFTITFEPIFTFEPTLYIIAQLGLPEHFTWLLNRLPLIEDNLYFTILEKLARLSRLTAGHKQIIEQILAIEPICQHLTRENQTILTIAINADNLSMAARLLQFDHVVADLVGTAHDLIRLSLRNPDSKIFSIMIQIPSVRELVINNAVLYINFTVSVGNIKATQMILAIPGVRPFIPGDNLGTLFHEAIENDYPQIVQVLLNLQEISYHRLPNNIPETVIQKILPLKNGYLLVTREPLYQNVLFKFNHAKVSALAFSSNNGLSADEVDLYYHMLAFSVAYPEENIYTQYVLNNCEKIYDMAGIKTNIHGENILLFNALVTGNWEIASDLLDNQAIFNNALKHNFYYRAIDPGCQARLHPFIVQNAAIMDRLNGGLNYQIDLPDLQNLLETLMTADHSAPIKLFNRHRHELIRLVNGMVAFSEDRMVDAWLFLQQKLHAQALQNIANAYILRLLHSLENFNFLTPVARRAHALLSAQYAFDCNTENDFKLSMIKLLHPGHTPSPDQFTSIEIVNDYTVLSFAKIKEIGIMALQEFQLFTNQETQLLNHNLIHLHYDPEAVANLFFKSPVFVQMLQKQYPETTKIRLLENLLHFPHAQTLEDGKIIYDLTEIMPDLENHIPEAYYQQHDLHPFNDYLNQQKNILQGQLHKFYAANICLASIQGPLEKIRIDAALINIHPLAVNQPRENYFAEIQRLLQIASLLVQGDFTGVVREAAAIFTHSNCREIVAQLIAQALEEENHLIPAVIETIIDHINQYKSMRIVDEPLPKRAFSLYHQINEDSALDALISTIRSHQSATNARITVQEIISNWHTQYNISSATWKFVHALAEQFENIEPDYPELKLTLEV